MHLLLRGCYSYHLEGNVVGWAKFDTLVYEGGEVALADVVGHFGSKLNGDDGALH